MRIRISGKEKADNEGMRGDEDGFGMRNQNKCVVQETENPSLPLPGPDSKK